MVFSFHLHDIEEKKELASKTIRELPGNHANLDGVANSTGPEKDCHQFGERAALPDVTFTNWLRRYISAELAGPPTHVVPLQS